MYSVVIVDSGTRTEYQGGPIIQRCKRLRRIRRIPFFSRYRLEFWAGARMEDEGSGSARAIRATEDDTVWAWAWVGDWRILRMRLGRLWGAVLAGTGEGSDLRTSEPPSRHDWTNGGGGRNRPTSAPNTEPWCLECAWSVPGAPGQEPFPMKIPEPTRSEALASSCRRLWNPLSPFRKSN